MQSVEHSTHPYIKNLHKISKQVDLIPHAIISPMHTPAGKECSYFYGDYYRGREREECRLLANSNPPQEWQPKLCFKCPVPGIEQANACEHMQLNGRVQRLFFVLPPEVKVTAYCTKSEQDVSEPHVGCGQCHTLPPIFTGEILDPDNTD